MGKKSRKSNKPGQHAPKQGVGESYDWIVNDMAVINLRPALATTFPANDQLTVTIACDANGFNYSSYSQNGATTQQFPTAALPGFGQQQPYGISNDQFTRLGMLWQEYRVNSISMHVVPTGPGGPLQVAGNYSCVDETGQFNRLDRRNMQSETALIPEMASQKSLTVHSPYTTTHRNFSLNKWLVQTQDTAWLPTQDKEYTALQRVAYATPVNQAATPAGTEDFTGLTPGLFSMLKFNITYQSAWMGVGVNVVFKTHYVFRQRRLLDPLQDMIISRQSDGIHVQKLSTTQAADAIDLVEEHALNESPSGKAERSGSYTPQLMERKPKSYTVESELTRSQMETMKDFIVNLK